MVIMKIKFAGLGIENEYQAYVKVYDGDELVFEGFTVNGEVCLHLKKNKVYRVWAKFFDEVINTSIYTSDCDYVLFFEHSILEPPLEPQTVTFLLRDFYYDIPIERGEIILWLLKNTSNY
jgi:hypothetical protein